MKKLSKEGRFECGLDEIVKGKCWAFTAVTNGDYWGLGIAVANEPGYYPIPLTWANVKMGPGAYEAMSEHADELNVDEGLAIKEADRIVISTMRRGGIAL